MSPSSWFSSFPLSPFSRHGSTSTTPSPSTNTHTSFPFFTPPPLSSTESPSPYGVSPGIPVTPAQASELEERDLMFVDRALLDFVATAGAAQDQAWLTEEKDVRVKALWVHPIKSCRGVSLSKSVITPQGLQYDRHWAIRETETSQMCTAREYPSMVLIAPEVDDERNLLVVRFPEEARLPGFAVRLQVDEAEIRGWQKVGPTIMHKKPLPPSYIPTYTAIPSSDPELPTCPSPSAQLSQYLGRSVEFIQKSPFEEDVRALVAPPVSKAMKEQGRDGEWLVAGELEYERGETGFADGYPVLLANEESFANVQSSLAASVNPTLDPTFTNIGPSFNQSLWQRKHLDVRRFRANVIVGRGDGSTPDEGLAAWEEEKWREVEFWGSENGGDDVRVHGEDEDVEMVPVHKVAARQERMVKRGGMICVSRCGRCQLPNVDPDSGEADKAVPYKIIAKYRRVDPAQKFTPIFGVNAVPQQAHAVVHVGDRVRVRGMNQWEVVEQTRG